MSRNTVLETPATSLSPERSTSSNNASRAPSGVWLMRQQTGQASSPVLRLCAVVSEVARSRRQS